MRIFVNGESLTFREAPVISKSLSGGGSKIQFDVGGLPPSSLTGGQCFVASTTTNFPGYPPSALALPYECIVETQSGQRLFRGYFIEYTTKYNSLDIISTLTFEDCTRFLRRRPITGTFKGKFSNIVNQLLEAGHATAWLDPVVYRVGTTRAQAAVKVIRIISQPSLNDIVIVGEKRYKYVVEAPTTDSELNIEMDISVVATELAAKITGHTSLTGCTAIADGNSITCTANLIGDDFLVFVDGTRITVESFLQSSAGAGFLDGEEVDVEDLPVNLVLDGQYLSDALSQLCSLADCGYYVDIATGRLNIYQTSELVNTDPVVIDIANSRDILCPDNSAAAYENLGYRRIAPSLDRVTIFGRNGSFFPMEWIEGEEPLSANVTRTSLETIKHDIPVGSTRIEYGYTETADKVLWVRLTPKTEEEPPEPPDDQETSLYKYMFTLAGAPQVEEETDGGGMGNYGRNTLLPDMRAVASNSDGRIFFAAGNRVFYIDETTCELVEIDNTGTPCPTIPVTLMTASHTGGGRLDAPVTGIDYLLGNNPVGGVLLAGATAMTFTASVVYTLDLTSPDLTGRALNLSFLSNLAASGPGNEELVSSVDASVTISIAGMEVDTSVTSNVTAVDGGSSPIVSFGTGTFNASSYIGTTIEVEWASMFTINPNSSTTNTVLTIGLNSSVEYMC